MIDCKKYADEILDGIKQDVDTGKCHGHLAVITIGDDEASKAYVRGKKKDCKRVGFGFTQFVFGKDCETSKIVRFINDLRANYLAIYDESKRKTVPSSEITGLIVQLPVPEHIDMNKIMAVIPRQWDVDGFLPKSPFKPCTPEGVMYVAKKEFGEDLTGRIMTIVGRGKLVGAPLREMALAENMTVIQCHSKTRDYDLPALIAVSDISVFATGHRDVFDTATLRHFKPTIIDCGINVDESGKLWGDVTSDGYDKITPVPGGVGLMTRAMLVKHCAKYDKK